MKKENVSARTKSLQSKSTCFDRNILILSIIFYLGKGGMLKKQLITLSRKIYNINEHKIQDMIADACSYGLLIKKQVTDTKTNIYVLTKFPLSIFRESTSRDTTSIRLTNHKLWNNIYRTEFIIRVVIPMMEKQKIDITLENIFNFMDTHSISVFTSENQLSIYQLYQSIEQRFPIKDKENIQRGEPFFSFFYNDLYASFADTYNLHTNFLGIQSEEDISFYQSVKEQLLDEKELTNSPMEQKKQYYNLYNMVAAGFFFIGCPRKPDVITIGIFDTYNNLTLNKIYQNIICIWYMLERYLGYTPKITLQVYMKDLDKIKKLLDQESQQGYDFKKQEHHNINKKLLIFQNMKVPKQYWEDITVDYIYFPLEEKYNL